MLFFCGIFLFFVGLESSKRSISKYTGNLVTGILDFLDRSLIISIGAGLLITCLVQSSSALTIILIMLLNNGLIKFKPALAMVMGANIGTTITVQIISLPVVKYYPYFMIIGLLLIISGGKTRKVYRSGIVVFSFALIFCGLNLMIDYFQQDKIQILLHNLLLFSGQGKLAGILLGTVITALIQSSSLITGIIVSLAYGNYISLSGAVAVALGSNIGTCFTGFLAAINTSKQAHLLATAQLFYNLIGVVVLLPFFELFLDFVKMTAETLPRQIANAHTLFNIFNLIIFLPFVEKFIKILRR